MRRKPQADGMGTFTNIKEYSAVFAEIPWHDYIDRMYFSGKLPPGAKTTTRSVTIEAKELRIAEVIVDNDKRFQTISDVLRDAVRKGLQIDYEILIKRDKKIKHRADATYLEIAYIDHQLAVLSHIEMVEKRIDAIRQMARKNIAGKGEEWEKVSINDLIEVADNDYPDEGVKEYFEQKLAQPQSAGVYLFNMEKEKRLKGL